MASGAPDLLLLNLPFPDVVPTLPNTAHAYLRQGPNIHSFWNWQPSCMTRSLAELAQELRAATLRQDERDVLRTIRRVADQALAAANVPHLKSVARLLRPSYPPSQALPALSLYPPTSTFPSAARTCGLLWAVASAAEAAAEWPERLHLAVLSTWAVLLRHPANCTYTIAQPHAILFIDRLQQQLTIALTAPTGTHPRSPEPRLILDEAEELVKCTEPVGSVHLDACCPKPPGTAATTSNGRDGLPPTTLLEAYLSIAVTVLNTCPRSPVLRGRRCDIVAYALACGIAYRLAQLLSLFDRTTMSAAPIPTCVQHCLLLLQVLTAGDMELATALESHGVAGRAGGLAASVDVNGRHVLRCKLSVRTSAARI
jgi:hypothetical protein